MAVSTFEMFKIGIGPSSSHTLGPMLASGDFVNNIPSDILPTVKRIKVKLYGSLALTGEGHHTHKAIILGLLGRIPHQLDANQAESDFNEVLETQRLALAGKTLIDFRYPGDIEFLGETFLPEHPNGMTLFAYDEAQRCMTENTYFSLGGGFIATRESLRQKASPLKNPIPYSFQSAADLLALTQNQKMSIADLMLANEQAWHQLDSQQVDQKLDEIWSVMDACIRRGCEQQGILPGGLDVKRRAAKMYQGLIQHPELSLKDPFTLMDWVSLFALAVNEENAAGGRVVTAPTNGAAGVIPAVIAYYDRFVSGSTAEGIRIFLLTTAAIGSLYKNNASISAAEVGCQGEIGVACSMAAAGLCAVLGGSPAQIENAAEIGMEHNLGMTCDPIQGLVQVPCIERNTMGALKAINAARLALKGDGQHRVSLDSVIETMWQTGQDMQSKYKETALGGLAVNVVLC